MPYQADILDDSMILDANGGTFAVAHGWPAEKRRARRDLIVDALNAWELRCAAAKKAEPTPRWGSTTDPYALSQTQRKE